MYAIVPTGNRSILPPPHRQAEKLEAEDDANKENEVFGSSGDMVRYELLGFMRILSCYCAHPRVCSTFIP